MEVAITPSNARQVLPRAFEFFRAISGLVAIAALLVIVTQVPAVTDSARPSSAVFSASVRPEPETSAPDRVARTYQRPLDDRRIVVFYLVADQYQESLADQGEQVGAMETFASGLPVPDRGYTILYARDEIEEQAAGAAILHSMLMLADDAVVEVIDLRDVCVAAC